VKSVTFSPENRSSAEYTELNVEEHLAGVIIALLNEKIMLTPGIEAMPACTFHLWD